MLKLNEEEKKVVKNVIEDLQNRIEMFSGKYDPCRKNGYFFVQGIGTAMEMFGMYVDEEYGVKIYDDFVTNMLKCEIEYERKQFEKSKEKFS